MNVYSHSGTSSDPLWLNERYIYGSSRLGKQQLAIKLEGQSIITSNDILDRTVGGKFARNVK